MISYGFNHVEVIDVERELVIKYHDKRDGDGKGLLHRGRSRGRGRNRDCVLDELKFLRNGYGLR